jgi:hypothetical protein
MVEPSDDACQRISHTSLAGNCMYIDPAAGSLILQVLVAGVLAVTASVKSARASVIRVLRGLFGARKDK